MILELEGWVFDVDLEATMAYSAKEAADHCDCAYCRNFYAAVDGVYPELQPFLARFGVDIEAPEELFPYDGNHYGLVYAANGRILNCGNTMEVDGLAVEFSLETPVNVYCPKPWFSIEFNMLELPWVLEEPFEDVVSPANAPGFLKKMWNKLLDRAEDTMKS